MSRYDVDAIINAIFMFGVMILFYITKDVNSLSLNWLLAFSITYHAVAYCYCQFKRSKEDE